MATILAPRGRVAVRSATRPVAPQDLLATLYQYMGVPLDTTFVDPTGRPVPLLPDGTLQCAGGVLVTGGPVPVAVWTHVACVFDGQRAMAYVGGVLKNTAFGSPGLIPTPEPAALGGNAPSGEPFVGAIDSLRIFKVARTAAQIAATASGN